MDAKELLVHDRSERKVAERLHAGVVEVLRVLVLAWRHCASAPRSARCSEERRLTLEAVGEVVGEMAALMVAAEKEEGIGEVDLERPEVQDALDLEGDGQHARGNRIE